MARPSGNPAPRRKPISANLLLTAGVVLLAVLVIGGILIFGGDDSDESGGGSAAPDELQPAGSHTLIEADGGVTVVEFLDFQCPACAGYYLNITKKLEQDYDGKITFVARNFPLDSHPLAVPAAKAAEAAAQQGKFRQMYHELYDNYESWAVTGDGKSLRDDAEIAAKQFLLYAKDIDLDVDKFSKDLDSAAVAKKIEQDQADGAELGVDSTPTFFVDGTRFTPTGQSFDEVGQELRAAIDKALEE